MIVVIDTNVVLSMFKKGHPNRPIFDAWVAGRLRWAVSTEVLLEYKEVAARWLRHKPAPVELREPLLPRIARLPSALDGLEGISARSLPRCGLRCRGESAIWLISGEGKMNHPW